LKTPRVAALSLLGRGVHHPPAARCPQLASNRPVDPAAAPAIGSSPRSPSGSNPASTQPSPPRDQAAAAHAHPEATPRPPCLSCACAVCCLLSCAFSAMGADGCALMVAWSVHEERPGSAYHPATPPRPASPRLPESAPRPPPSRLHTDLPQQPTSSSGVHPPSLNPVCVPYIWLSVAGLVAGETLAPLEGGEPRAVLEPLATPPCLSAHLHCSSLLDNPCGRWRGTLQGCWRSQPGGRVQQLQPVQSFTRHPPRGEPPCPQPQLPHARSSRPLARNSLPVRPHPTLSACVYRG
jgi:hypothetical protein